MLEKVFISVILPLKLEWEPCYFVKRESASQFHVGDRVKVNFAGRNYVAVISGVDIEPSADIKKIKEAVFDSVVMDAVHPIEIELWKMVADYYLCTVGEVYKAAYPAGKTNLEVALAARKLREEARRLKKISDLEDKLERYSAKILKMESKIDAKKHQIERAVKIESRERYITEYEKVIADKKSLIQEQEELKQSISELKNILANPATTSCRHNSNCDCKLKLTDAQQIAYNKIIDGFSLGKPVMLHGVTGAGKTEIYLKLASEVISKGLNVLYLVPEIALSRQLEYRLKEHFHNNLYIFHSGQSAAQRRDIADSIRHITSNNNISQDRLNNPYIVLGTRSAIFLPHNKLGLIIVDEEHDSSYKQDSPAPRYNGRDTALMLAKLQDENLNSCYNKSARQEQYPQEQLRRCNIILGSATPSLEEVYNCATGRHALVKLNERFHGADDSDIEIIDTKAERRKNGMVGSFSRKLILKINTILSEGGQIMILRSRRAWSTSMQCSECGEIVKCPHCNVSLSLHGRPENGRLICHYCGYSRVFEDKCEKCGSSLVPLSTGTQRIEEEVLNLFPNARVARLDSDSAKDKEYEKQTIQDFSDGKIDILVGTQIVAKGFDFSNLRLVAVIAADALLSMQDFRADEKAIQLLEQFRGRCGRREHKGLFVIQTSQPGHPIYQRIAMHETELFAEGLLQERKEFGFPPYSRIVEIQIKDKFENRLAATSSRLAKELHSQLDRIYNSQLSVVTGPYTPIPDKLADYYLRMIRISLKKDRNLSIYKGIIRNIVNDFETKAESMITINVDPS